MRYFYFKNRLWTFKIEDFDFTGWKLKKEIVFCKRVNSKNPVWGNFNHLFGRFLGGIPDFDNAWFIIDCDEISGDVVDPLNLSAYLLLLLEDHFGLKFFFRKQSHYVRLINCNENIFTRVDSNIKNTVLVFISVDVLIITNNKTFIWELVLDRSFIFSECALENFAI